MTGQTIIFLGPQGSGKGTQAKLLTKVLNAEFIEMGALLREVSQQDTEFGRYIKDTIDKGIYTTDEDVAKVLREKLPAIDLAKPLIFDGVPRRMGQAEFLLNELKKVGRDQIDTILIDLPREESLKRLSLRRVCEGCKNAITIQEGKEIEACEKCGGKMVQRKDDTPEFIERRLKQHEELTLPVIDYLRSVTKVHDINGNQSVEAVAEDIRKSLGQ